MPQAAQPKAASRNLVIADMFFGLGAVLLIVIAVISLSVGDMLADLIAATEPDAADTSSAVEKLAVSQGTILYATPDGLERITAETRTSLPLDQITSAAPIDEWLAEAPLLVVDIDGPEAAFLTFAIAARQNLAAVTTLRLSSACRTILVRAGDQFACGR